MAGSTNTRSHPRGGSGKEDTSSSASCTPACCPPAAAGAPKNIEGSVAMGNGAVRICGGVINRKRAASLHFLRPTLEASLSSAAEAGAENIVAVSPLRSSAREGCDSTAASASAPVAACAVSSLPSSPLSLRMVSQTQTSTLQSMWGTDALACHNRVSVGEKGSPRRAFPLEKEQSEAGAMSNRSSIRSPIALRSLYLSPAVAVECSAAHEDTASLSAASSAASPIATSECLTTRRSSPCFFFLPESSELVPWTREEDTMLLSPLPLHADVAADFPLFAAAAQPPLYLSLPLPLLPSDIPTTSTNPPTTTITGTVGFSSTTSRNMATNHAAFLSPTLTTPEDLEIVCCRRCCGADLPLVDILAAATFRSCCLELLNSLYLPSRRQLLWNKVKQRLRADNLFKSSHVHNDQPDTTSTVSGTIPTDNTNTTNATTSNTATTRSRSTLTSTDAGAADDSGFLHSSTTSACAENLLPSVPISFDTNVGARFAATSETREDAKEVVVVLRDIVSSSHIEESVSQTKVSIFDNNRVIGHSNRANAESSRVDIDSIRVDSSSSSSGCLSEWQQISNKNDDVPPVSAYAEAIRAYSRRKRKSSTSEGDWSSREPTSPRSGKFDMHMKRKHNIREAALRELVLEDICSRFFLWFYMDAGRKIADDGVGCCRSRRRLSREWVCKHYLSLLLMPLSHFSIYPRFCIPQPRDTQKSFPHEKSSEVSSSHEKMPHQQHQHHQRRHHQHLQQGEREQCAQDEPQQQMTRTANQQLQQQNEGHQATPVDRKIQHQEPAIHTQDTSDESIMRRDKQAEQQQHDQRQPQHHRSIEEGKCLSLQQNGEKQQRVSLQQDVHTSKENDFLGNHSQPVDGVASKKESIAVASSVGGINEIVHTMEAKTVSVHAIEKSSTAPEDAASSTSRITSTGDTAGSLSLCSGNTGTLFDDTATGSCETAPCANTTTTTTTSAAAVGALAADPATGVGVRVVDSAAAAVPISKEDALPVQSHENQRISLSPLPLFVVSRLDHADNKISGDTAEGTAEDPSASENASTITANTSVTSTAPTTIRAREEAPSDNGTNIAASVAIGPMYVPAHATMHGVVTRTDNEPRALHCLRHKAVRAADTYVHHTDAPAEEGSSRRSSNSDSVAPSAGDGNVSSSSDSTAGILSYDYSTNCGSNSSRSSKSSKEDNECDLTSADRNILNKKSYNSNTCNCRSKRRTLDSSNSPTCTRKSDSVTLQNDINDRSSCAEDLTDNNRGDTVQCGENVPQQSLESFKSSVGGLVRARCTRRGAPTGSTVAASTVKKVDDGLTGQQKRGSDHVSGHTDSQQRHSVLDGSTGGKHERGIGNISTSDQQQTKSVLDDSTDGQQQRDSHRHVSTNVCTSDTQQLDSHLDGSSGSGHGPHQTDSRDVSTIDTQEMDSILGVSASDQGQHQRDSGDVCASAPEQRDSSTVCTRDPQQDSSAVTVSTRTAATIACGSPSIVDTEAAVAEGRAAKVTKKAALGRRIGGGRAKMAQKNMTAKTSGLESDRSDIEVIISDSEGDDNPCSEGCMLQRRRADHLAVMTNRWAKERRRKISFFSADQEAEATVAAGRTTGCTGEKHHFDQVARPLWRQMDNGSVPETKAFSSQHIHHDGTPTNNTRAVCVVGRLSAWKDRASNAAQAAAASVGSIRAAAHVSDVVETATGAAVTEISSAAPTAEKVAHTTVAERATNDSTDSFGKAVYSPSGIATAIEKGGKKRASEQQLAAGPTVQPAEVEGKRQMRPPLLPPAEQNAGTSTVGGPVKIMPVQLSETHDEATSKEEYTGRVHANVKKGPADAAKTHYTCRRGRSKKRRRYELHRKTPLTTNVTKKVAITTSKRNQGQHRTADTSHHGRRTRNSSSGASRTPYRQTIATTRIDKSASSRSLRDDEEKCVDTDVPPTVCGVRGRRSPTDAATAAAVEVSADSDLVESAATASHRDVAVAVVSDGFTACADVQRPIVSARNRRRCTAAVTSTTDSSNSSSSISTITTTSSNTRTTHSSSSSTRSNSSSSSSASTTTTITGTHKREDACSRTAMSTACDGVITSGDAVKSAAKSPFAASNVSAEVTSASMYIHACTSSTTFKDQGTATAVYASSPVFFLACRAALASRRAAAATTTAVVTPSSAVGVTSSDGMMTVHARSSASSCDSPVIAATAASPTKSNSDNLSSQPVLIQRTQRTLRVTLHNDTDGERVANDNNINNKAPREESSCSKNNSRSRYCTKNNSSSISISSNACDRAARKVASSSHYDEAMQQEQQQECKKLRSRSIKQQQRQLEEDQAENNSEATPYEEVLPQQREPEGQRKKNREATSDNEKSFDVSQSRRTRRDRAEEPSAGPDACAGVEQKTQTSDYHKINAQERIAKAGVAASLVAEVQQARKRGASNWKARLVNERKKPIAAGGTAGSTSLRVATAVEKLPMSDGDTSTFKTTARRSARLAAATAATAAAPPPTAEAAAAPGASQTAEAAAAGAPSTAAAAAAANGAAANVCAAKGTAVTVSARVQKAIACATVAAAVGRIDTSAANRLRAAQTKDGRAVKQPSSPSPPGSPIPSQNRVVRSTVVGCTKRVSRRGKRGRRRGTHSGSGTDDKDYRIIAATAKKKVKVTLRVASSSSDVSHTARNSSSSSSNSDSHSTRSSSGSSHNVKRGKSSKTKISSNAARGSTSETSTTNNMKRAAHKCVRANNNDYAVGSNSRNSRGGRAAKSPSDVPSTRRSSSSRTTSGDILKRARDSGNHCRSNSSRNSSSSSRTVRNNSNSNRTTVSTSDSNRIVSSNSSSRKRKVSSSNSINHIKGRSTKSNNGRSNSSNSRKDNEDIINGTTGGIAQDVYNDETINSTNCTSSSSSNVRRSSRFRSTGGGICTDRVSSSIERHNRKVDTNVSSEKKRSCSTNRSSKSSSCNINVSFNLEKSTSNKNDKSRSRNVSAGANRDKKSSNSNKSLSGNGRVSSGSSEESSSSSSNVKVSASSEDSSSTSSNSNNESMSIHADTNNKGSTNATTRQGLTSLRDFLREKFGVNTQSNSAAVVRATAAAAAGGHGAAAHAAALSQLMSYIFKTNSSSTSSKSRNDNGSAPASGCWSSTTAAHNSSRNSSSNSSSSSSAEHTMRSSRPGENVLLNNSIRTTTSTDTSCENSTRHGTASTANFFSGKSSLSAVSTLSVGDPHNSVYVSDNIKTGTRAKTNKSLNEKSANTTSSTGSNALPSSPFSVSKSDAAVAATVACRDVASGIPETATTIAVSGPVISKRRECVAATSCSCDPSATADAGFIMAVATATATSVRDCSADGEAAEKSHRCIAAAAEEEEAAQVCAAAKGSSSSFHQGRALHIIADTDAAADSAAAPAHIGNSSPTACQSEGNAVAAVETLPRKAATRATDERSAAPAAAHDASLNIAAVEGTTYDSTAADDNSAATADHSGDASSSAGARAGREDCTASAGDRCCSTFVSRLPQGIAGGVSPLKLRNTAAATVTTSGVSGIPRLVAASSSSCSYRRTLPPSSRGVPRPHISQGASNRLLSRLDSPSPAVGAAPFSLISPLSGARCTVAAGTTNTSGAPVTDAKAAASLCPTNSAAHVPTLHEGHSADEEDSVISESRPPTITSVVDPPSAASLPLAAHICSRTETSGIADPVKHRSDACVQRSCNNTATVTSQRNSSSMSNERSVASASLQQRQLQQQQQPTRPRVVGGLIMHYPHHHHQQQQQRPAKSAPSLLHGTGIHRVGTSAVDRVAALAAPRVALSAAVSTVCQHSSSRPVPRSAAAPARAANATPASTWRPPTRPLYCGGSAGATSAKKKPADTE